MSQKNLSNHGDVYEFQDGNDGKNSANVSIKDKDDEVLARVGKKAQLKVRH